MDMEIILGDLENPQVLDLLKRHLDGMHESSKAGIVMGCGALKSIDNQIGEIKSMRTHSDHLRQGVAARILDHIISQARQRHYSRLSLETGTTPEFDAALNLYSKYGFEIGEPFGDYTDNAFSQFMHLDLVPV